MSIHHALQAVMTIWQLKNRCRLADTLQDDCDGLLPLAYDDDRMVRHHRPYDDRRHRWGAPIRNLTVGKENGAWCFRGALPKTSEETA